MEEEGTGPLMLMPGEIIGIILKNLKIQDLVHFSATCKQFHEFVTTHQYIWKEKFKELLPHRMLKVIEKHGDGNWLYEMKRFYAVKGKVYEELMLMSPKFYWRASELTIEDVKSFFQIAVSYNMNYHYVIHVLQEVIKTGIKYADRNYNERMGVLTQRAECLSLLAQKTHLPPPKRPFNMTDVYYAKIAVRYLTQSFLAVKWVQGHTKGQLTPEAVVNVFIQWVDPVNMHTEEAVRDSINILVAKVEAMFPNDKSASEYLSLPEKLAKGLITEQQMLEAVSDVIYKQHHLAIMSGANLLGLNIVKSIQNKCCSLIVAAVIYQAVARYCGVHCELIAFPNHLFLEWRSSLEPVNSYKIDLETGEMAPQGRCPFAPTEFRKEYKFNPDGFLQYIISGFLMTMGSIKNWYTQNALFLLDFLSNNINEDNPYKDYLPYLDSILDYNNLSQFSMPLELEYVHDNYLQIINALVTLNPPVTHLAREGAVKRRDPNVTFAVGMLAYHKKYDYLCVVRGWDAKCTTDWRRRIEFKDLEYGSRQPFYSVIVVDQSDRYVAQENLIHVDRPTRLFHLEDVIAKEFSHFDGYCYVPNNEKDREYPEDEIVRSVYRARAQQRAAELREAL